MFIHSVFVSKNMFIDLVEEDCAVMLQLLTG